MPMYAGTPPAPCMADRSRTEDDDGQTGAPEALPKPQQKPGGSSCAPYSNPILQSKREATEEEKTMRDVRGAVNKLTPERYGLLKEKVLQIVAQILRKQQQERVLREIVKIVYKAAVKQKHMAEMYAKLCKDVMVHERKTLQSCFFREVLLNHCQEEFETDVQDGTPTAQLERKVQALREVREAVNKLTPERYVCVKAEVCNIVMQVEEDILAETVMIVYEAAVTQEHLVGTHAELCKDVLKDVLAYSMDTVRSVLGCHFKARQRLGEAPQRSAQLERWGPAGLSHQEQQEQQNDVRFVERFKYLLLTKEHVRFVGELFKRQLLTQDIIFSELKLLQRLSGEDQLDMMAELLTTIGHQLDKEAPSGTSCGWYPGGGGNVIRKERDWRWAPETNPILQSKKDASAEEKTVREVRRAVNKLTPERYGPLKEKVLSIVAQIVREQQAQKQGRGSPAETAPGGGKEGGILDEIVKIVHEAAVTQKHLAGTYAELCRDVARNEATQRQENVGKSRFRRMLVNHCQMTFETLCQDSSRRAQLKSSGVQMTPEQESQDTKAQKRAVGNIHFLGELFKHNLLTEKIMHAVLKRLMCSETGDKDRLPEEDQLDMMAELLNTIGKQLDKGHGKSYVMFYMRFLTKLCNDQRISNRVRFKLQTVTELRERHWMPRRKADWMSWCKADSVKVLTDQEQHWKAINKARDQEGEGDEGARLPVEDQLDTMAELLTTLGYQLDEGIVIVEGIVVERNDDDTVEAMEQYMKTLTNLSNDKRISSRMRVKLLDIIQQRQRSKPSWEVLLHKKSKGPSPPGKAARGANSFASRQWCFKCGAAKEGGSGGGGGGGGGFGGAWGGGGGGNVRGDWTCPSCNANCFASRSSCFKSGSELDSESGSELASGSTEFRSCSSFFLGPVRPRCDPTVDERCGQPGLKGLPNDIFRAVFSMLRPEDVVASLTVAKFWQSLALDFLRNAIVNGSLVPTHATEVRQINADMQENISLNDMSEGWDLTFFELFPSEASEETAHEVVPQVRTLARRCNTRKCLYPLWWRAQGVDPRFTKPGKISDEFMVLVAVLFAARSYEVLVRPHPDPDLPGVHHCFIACEHDHGSRVFEIRTRLVGDPYAHCDSYDDYDYGGHDDYYDDDDESYDRYDGSYYGNDGYDYVNGCEKFSDEWYECR
eukprot:Hpha_TRINITY_DN16144_c1_g10::TRINITY_DN16144_c1_g10_i1::g.4697::m.4697/K03260/EIF4G; translation initiation factor 4G